MNRRLNLGLKDWFGEPKSAVPDDLVELAQRRDEKLAKAPSASDRQQGNPLKRSDR